MITVPRCIPEGHLVPGCSGSIARDGPGLCSAIGSRRTRDQYRAVCEEHGPGDAHPLGSLVEREKPGSSGSGCLGTGRTEPRPKPCAAPGTGAKDAGYVGFRISAGPAPGDQVDPGEDDEDGGTPAEPALDRLDSLEGPARRRDPLDEQEREDDRRHRRRRRPTARERGPVWRAGTSMPSRD